MNTEIAIAYLSNSILVLTALLAFLTLIFTFLLKNKKLNHLQFIFYVLVLLIILYGIYEGMDIIYNLKNPLSEENVNSISEYRNIVGGIFSISFLLFFYSFYKEK